MANRCNSVLQENLESHVRRCPFLKQVQSLTQQPFYQKGINSGYDEDEDENNVTSQMKRDAVYSLSVPQFSALIRKIETLHASICEDIRDSFLIPESCSIWIKREIDRKIPYQEKHVVQQASIIGNLEELGALKKPDEDKLRLGFRDGVECDGFDKGGDIVPAVVEFGAGRGYLTQMLADCYGVKRVFLVERRSYKLKADRSLRQKESLILERLRIDIEDLNLYAVESLRGVPYLAIGKHLCGPATDFTLRCCLKKRHDQDRQLNIPSRVCLRGLAIATCCHHLCQWKHYTNKRYLMNLGITKEDFNAITWFTSWAVDADHGSEVSEAMDCNSHVEFVAKGELKGNESGIEDVVKNMKPAERAVFGFKCKEIIDMGRLVWISEHGSEANLVKYVPSNISPENHLLVARFANPL
ncbi:Methyltransferase TRM13 [Dillenia turbinata]|uniref:tRNA:m(4)X modification enzyme TRM13 n=1 Tax=Dillenia turbinata TaxID=194707 RepID=A0AAN8VW81_9MAGN